MSKDSLDNIDAKLSEMLTNSMHTFDVAMNCLLGDTNLDTVRDDLYATDKAINELHREVRREMIVHSAVNSRNLDIPLLLSYMTMSKDIERIGDYCKNLFEIAETGNTFTKGDNLDDYIELRNDIGKLIVYLQSCLALDDESKVQDLITLGSSISSNIDTKITELLENKESIQYPVATTLFYRYLKRIVSHIVNAATALIMPTDQIDYLDE
jgi:phosphate transport system protein